MQDIKSTIVTLFIVQSMSNQKRDVVCVENMRILTTWL